ncbi:MAG TPA: DUF1302 family protein, partial [Solimonas sp.]|nr:DUF1302 family protein [Solimonas sp.]
PESNNYDDGDRNFTRGSLVNNRLTLLGEFLLQKDDYGLLLRGDAFYDRVYRGYNDNDSPGTVNKSAGETNQFTEAAQHFDGRRARLLDAYLFGSWYVGEEGALNLRVGRHIAAWGESLFFSGVALAQSPADATKATVPGADVKSILLPVNQVSLQWSLDSDWTVLGQYKLEFKETELNPVGEFFSVTDVVGPGAEFIYGIKNPLYLDNLADADLLSDDLIETLALVGELIAPDQPLSDILGQLDIPDQLPPLHLPVTGLAIPGTPRNINVPRGPDVRPSDFGQWGLGIKYQVTPTTNLGLYRLRYHNTTPAPVQNYGYGELVPASGLRPAITTEAFGLQIPISYNVHYFDGIDMTAGSFSTALFGANVGGELVYRQGIDVLVDVDGGLLGPVPTPTRADIEQALVSALYTIGPALVWDSMTLVAETSFIHVGKIEPAHGPDGQPSTDLTYTRDAWGYSLLALIDKRNLYPGWDLQVPLFFQGVGDGHSSLLGGLGSLQGEGDRRLSVGANFTRLQALQLGASYNAFLGKPDFSQRPYADRDFAAFTIKYSF